MSVMAKRLGGSKCHLYGGRPHPRPHCARWEPSSHSPKKGAQPPFFDPCLLWPNSWMDQDATWYGGMPWPRPDGDPATPPKKGQNPQFLARVYCGQMAGWIKISLGTEVNLGPGDVVLDEVAAPPLPKRGTAPSFRFMSIVAKRQDGWRRHFVCK